MEKTFAIVVAADEARGIGRNGKLPWRLPRELAHFRRLTSGAPGGHQNAVIMGRKTFESIPAAQRPLPDRLNIVLSRELGYAPEGALHASSLDLALAEVADRPRIDQIFVIGGGELFRAALEHPRCTRVYLTLVHASFVCDTHLPPLRPSFRRVESDGPHTEDDLSYTYETYERAR